MSLMTLSRHLPSCSKRRPGFAAAEFGARNKLKGKIVDVKKGATTTHVKIDIGGAVVTSSATNETEDELKLAAGQTAYAVIKASDVMVGIDQVLPAARSGLGAPIFPRVSLYS